MTQSTTRHPIRIGVQLRQQHSTYQTYADAVRRAEDLGVDTIWDWDHFFPLTGNAQGSNFEGWTLLTAMATLTLRAEIGCLVTCNSYRNPTLLADMAKTVDHISNGRLILGIGAGWFERDYQAYGYEFGTAGSRLASLEQGLARIKAHWEVCVPVPIRNPIPILLGGGGEKVTLRLVAQYATLSNTFGDPATVAHKMQVLDNWCCNGYLGQLFKKDGFGLPDRSFPLARNSRDGQGEPDHHAVRERKTPSGKTNRCLPTAWAPGSQVDGG